MIFEENKQKIDEYINQFNPKEEHNFNVHIQDKLMSLTVYRLPIDCLYYNIKNGRFALEYIEETRKLKRELNSQNQVDSEIIENILLSLDPKQTEHLKQDLDKIGQQEPGIITTDGFVINGNRRLAILKGLLSKTDTRFKFMLVVRLPSNVTLLDLWKIEGGLQLSRPTRLDYGPINTILKIKEGIDTGLTPSQISTMLYGVTKDRINEDLHRFKIMEEYLDYLNKSQQYVELNRTNVHFINLMPALNWAKINLPNNNFEDFKYIAFELIASKLNYFTIRNLLKILKYDKSQKKLLSSQRYLMITKKSNSISYLIKMIYEQALDIYNAKNNEPSKKLDKVLINLEAITNIDELLKDSSNKNRIQKIEKELQRIMNLIEFAQRAS